MNLSIKLTNKSSIVELAPFSRHIDNGKEIVLFFTSPFSSIGFGYKSRTVKDKETTFSGLRFKWYNWKTIPYVTFDIKEKNEK